MNVLITNDMDQQTLSILKSKSKGANERAYRKAHNLPPLHQMTNTQLIQEINKRIKEQENYAERQKRINASQ